MRREAGGLSRAFHRCGAGAIMCEYYQQRGRVESDLHTAADETCHAKMHHQHEPRYPAPHW